MLNGGVIGFGRMGITHFAILNTHPEVQWTAVCDSSSFVLKSVSRLMPVDVYSKPDELLARDDLDFVVIATPTDYHTELVEAAFAKGLHVFVEKPLAPSSAESDRLLQNTNRASLVNQVGYFLRYNEPFELAKSYLDQGLIGTVTNYRNEMHGPAILKPSKKGWRTEGKRGGGCLLDYASHCVDLSDYLFGSVERVAAARMPSIVSKGVEDAVYATLHYSCGMTGNLSVNWSDASYRRPYNRVEITGSKGKIVADRLECRLFLRADDPSGELKAGWTIRYLPELEKHVRFNIRGTEFTRQLDDFVDAIVGTDPQRGCCFSTAHKTDTLLDQIRSVAAETAKAS